MTVIAAVAVGGFIFAFSAPKQDEVGPLPPAVERVFPPGGNLGLSQTTISADLAPGYTGYLLVDGVEVPRDDLQIVPALNSITLAPLPGSDYETLGPVPTAPPSSTTSSASRRRLRPAGSNGASGSTDRAVTTGQPDPECRFCAIVAGTSPAATVLDDDHAVAFLDVRPVFPGHTLLVPRAHHETLADLPAAAVEALFLTARSLSVAVEDAMGAEGTFVAINNKVSQSVPHLHVHVVPRRRKDGLRGFFWPRTRYADDNEMDQVAARIREALGSR